MNSFDRQNPPLRQSSASVIGRGMARPITRPMARTMTGPMPMRSSVLGAMLLTVLGGLGIALEGVSPTGRNSAMTQVHAMGDFALADRSLTGLLLSERKLAELPEVDFSYLEPAGRDIQTSQRLTPVVFHAPARSGAAPEAQARLQP